ncbi:transmembrane protein 33-like [Panonychus citri]|uniref:transmembrane protein 33-like n=1 Tax=Panonychus citri TaxID=50023 RepID=UPI002307EB62|nr:transmembrane protein 33-like [Panonychus citri]
MPPEPDQSSSSAGDPPPPPSSSSSSQQQPTGRRLGFDEIIQYLTTNPLYCLTFFTRLATLFFTLLHIVPFLTNNSSLSYYQKALLANGATSAIRLHQRLPAFRLNREFMDLLLAEDSCHYLFFSLIFLSHNPITLVLLPLTLFASLHLTRSVLTIIETLEGSRNLQNNLSLFLARYTPVMLQTVALSEIFIMPVIILALITGMGSLMAPFLYYRFIVLRYASRRNPYSAQTFRQLRVTIETFAMRPQCPNFLRNVSFKLINLTCRLAPPRITVSAPH